MTLNNGSTQRDGGEQQPNGVAFDWQAAAKAKKAASQDRIPPAWRLNVQDFKALDNVIAVPGSCGILSSHEMEITELDDVDLLLKKMVSGEWTAEEVTTAFCKRAAIAHQLTNCLSEFWFEEAIARARELDKVKKEGGEPGLLHGLPVSIKDQFQIAGKECNMCWASWIGRISTENSFLVDSLLSAGAVIITRTNMAQGAWFPEGDNHVYGRVDNPFNRSRVSGGSSAGEGPLGILKGSAVGVGTDIGGSVRIPATFNSLFGLRSTTRRFPYGRALNTLMGQENVASSLGPMSSNLAGCVAFTRGVLSTEPWLKDASVVPLPWREDDYRLKEIGGGAKLAIGYYDFDGEVHVHPPIKRAMKQVIDALKKAGHTVIPWEKPREAEATRMVMRFFEADGGADMQDVVGKTGETIMPQCVVGDKNGLSVFELYQLNRKKIAFRNELLEQWQNTSSQTGTSRPIDALLCPVAPYVAPLHRTEPYIAYTAIYNVLDWPALTIPVAFVDPEKDDSNAGYDAVGEVDQRIKEMWDKDGSVGMPVGLQLVGQSFGEEKLLGAARVIVDAYKAAAHNVEG